MVGEIISEWRARSNRNGGRDHSGMVGDIERNQHKMRDLENMAAKLLESAHKLPPGSERHELLKEIGIFRARIAAIVAKREQLQSAK
jgi:hypothetical protein